LLFLNTKALFKSPVKYFLAVAVFFAITESSIRLAYSIRNLCVQATVLPYAMGGYYGPIPPWIKYQSMIKLDRRMVWVGTPNFYKKYLDDFSPVKTDVERYSLIRRFLPTIPDSLKDKPTWEMSLNSEGFRGEEIPKKNDPSAFRIVCLGDSWTVGSNVNINESYPYLIEAILDKEYPDEKFQAFNLGVFGYSSSQGLMLMTRALRLKPNVLVIGFAMNEAKNSTKNIERTGRNNSFPRKISKFVENAFAHFSQNIESYKLLKYWALVLKWKPKPMDSYFQDVIGGNEYYQNIENPKKQKTWFKNTLEIYEQNILKMLQIAKKNHIKVVLLYPEFSTQGPFLKVLERISKEKMAPLVDASRLIANERVQIEKDLEEKMNLSPRYAEEKNVNGIVDVIFRVYSGDYQVRKTMYITGTEERLGSLVPNKIAMYDDGTHGDQRAGDKVWSYSAKFPIGTRIFYVYTNSGTEGKWDGLDVPDIRYLKVEPVNKSSVLYAPIDTFGIMYMKADPWHPNALGNKLIAEAVFEKVRETRNFKNYVKQQTAEQ
jgi:lysophospholipase L1-like esterase